MHSCPFGFSSVWIVICGVLVRPGEPLTPAYIGAANVAKLEQVRQVDAAKLLGLLRPPYPTGPKCLLVTIDAEKLAGCHLALGWRLPERIVDLTVEFRNATNGRQLPCGSGFAGALVWFGLPAADGLNVGTSPAAVCRRLMAVARLFEAMQSQLDLGRAVLRGRYLTAVARMESVGVPVDRGMAMSLRAYWTQLRLNLVKVFDPQFNFFRQGQFQPRGFEFWLIRHEIDWPRFASGTLDLSDAAFRDMARVHPKLRPIKELRSTLARFDPSALAIGSDGRSRTPIRPFASRTGRNQPSSKASVFGSAAWVRNLVRPAPGMGLALIDWTQQEFGIAAALSEDAAMLAAYATGDPYLAFAITAGAAPSDATRATHGDIREQFKACVLGVQYGMGPATLARLAKITEAKASQLISWHRTVFAAFWSWSDAIEAQGMLMRRLQSVFGWQVAVRRDVNPRFLRNFPMQANGAEMLRLACCLVTEAGIRVCFPLHDAVLIEAPLAELDTAIATTERLMAEASRVVLDGFALRTKSKVVRYPDRLGDSRGQSVWVAIEQSLKDVASATDLDRPAHARNATCAETTSRPIYFSGSMEECPDASN